MTDITYRVRFDIEMIGSPDEPPTKFGGGTTDGHETIDTALAEAQMQMQKLREQAEQRTNTRRDTPKI